MLIEAIVIALLAGVVGALLWSISRTRATDRRYRLMLEHLPQSSVTLFGKDLRLQLVAGGALAESGLTSPELEGKLLGEVVPGKQGDALARHYTAALRGESCSLEYKSTISGRDFWLTVVPVRDGGEVIAGLAVAQDITERKKAQLAHERAEDARRQTIEVMNEAYIAIDAEGNVTDWNPQATELFGYSQEEAVGRPVRSLILPPEDRETFDSRFAARVAGDTERLGVRAERTAIDKDGRRFPVELAVAVLRQDGEISLHAFMHDISDRKRAEVDARRHAEEVEAIADATGALARSTDPEQAREAICRAAVEVAEADIAVLLEPEPGGKGLVATAAYGASASSETVPFVGPPSWAARAFTSNEPVFVPNLRIEDMARLVDTVAPRSAYWVPVRRGGSALGVVVVGWKSRRTSLSPGLERVMGLVAAEAAVAIDRASLLDRLARMARTDDLTGLPNRRAWEQEMVRETARAARWKTPLTVAMVDLDYFKTYNDTHGHQAGDRLLKEAAGAWRGVLRETDVIARYGGEEFAIALPGCPLEEAERLIERLRAVTPSGESCSAGIAAWDGSESAEGLLGRADQALYQAKQGGRNRTVTA